jgi:Domain of unknown function (DUF427)
MTHTATWNGTVIAISDKTIEVGGYRYFPRDSVKMALLKSTPKTPVISSVRTAFSSTTSSMAAPRVRVQHGPTRRRSPR